MLRRTVNLKRLLSGLVVLAASGTLVLANPPGDGEPCPGNDDGMILVCHYPPGDADNPHEIWMAEPAAAAHLGHGDTCGACPGDGGGGGDNSGNGDDGGGVDSVCSLNDDGTVTLCHNGHTIQVNSEAAEPHVLHGDTCGPCDGDDGGDGGDGGDDGDGGDGGDGGGGDGGGGDGGAGDDGGGATAGAPSCETLDSDADGINNCDDLCPGSTDLADSNGCDFCQLDNDGDGLFNCEDNCPDMENAAQIDTDNGGVGDVCDPDDDNDRIADRADNCPLTPNTDQLDADDDGLGDVCDDCPDDPGPAPGCPETPEPITQLQPIAPAQLTQEDADSLCGLCGEGSIFGFGATLIGLAFIRLTFIRGRRRP